jgi:UDP-N-acetylmuramoyl-L-alanyl-D-glutamate--2,6-diaminopimelate ligase
MGQIAREGGDVVVLTSDNPRTEDPSAIIADILSGGVSADHVEVDRRAAIEWALSSATSGDSVLIAGKGHEDYQIIGRERKPFSDQKVVREWVRR